MYVLIYSEGSCSEGPLFVSSSKDKLKEFVDHWKTQTNVDHVKILPQEITLGSFVFVKQSDGSYDCEDMTIPVWAELFVCPVRSV